jgi:hypothetical protein
LQCRFAQKHFAGTRIPAAAFSKNESVAAFIPMPECKKTSARIPLREVFLARKTQIARLIYTYRKKNHKNGANSHSFC